MLNQILQTGSRGIAGHIGHTLADPNGAICGCGRRGCVEAIASGRAIEAVSSQWEDPCDPKKCLSVLEKMMKKRPHLSNVLRKPLLI